MATIYHPGELSVQTRAGRRDMANRVGKSIRAAVPPSAQEFLRRQPLAIIGTVDSDGRHWASLLSGHPGFMQTVDEQTVRITARPTPGDPLADNLAIGGHAGVIVIDFATRHRMRLNGNIQLQPDDTILLHVRQAYANCPKYIQARQWQIAASPSPQQPLALRAAGITEGQENWIHRADTFFVASSYPDGGADASHRGGNPGFVRVVNRSRLVWPDYSGNMMFQTLGNIAANPRIGLLFMDFENGGTLQLTGQAYINWDPDRSAAFSGAERLIEFDIEEAVEIIGASPFRWRFLESSPFNPTGRERKTDQRFSSEG